MIIERFFGKRRESQAKPRDKDETKPRRTPGKSPDAESPVPRFEAADAPASPTRSGEAAVARRATEAPIGVVSAPDPSNDEIAARAYDLWQKQGCPEGRERENWIEAERQLRAERTEG